MASEDNIKKENIDTQKSPDTASARAQHSKKPEESLKRKKRADSSKRNVNKSSQKNTSREASADNELLPTVSSVKKKIDVEKARKATERSKKPKLIIKFDNVTKRYGARTVIRDLSLTLNKGELMTILAPEGQGKSTIAKLASGLVSPTRGSVIIKGENAGRRTNSIVSYQPDIPYFKYDNTVSDILNYYDRFFKDFSYKRAYQLLKHFGIARKTKLENLSTTALFIVQVILVSSRRASLYIFDDPIVHCDPKYRKEITKMIDACRKFGAIILLSQTASNIDDISDKLVFIKNGSIIKAFYDADSYEEEFGESKIGDIYKEVYKNA